MRRRVQREVADAEDRGSRLAPRRINARTLATSSSNENGFVR